MCSTVICIVVQFKIAFYFLQSIISQCQTSVWSGWQSGLLCHCHRDHLISTLATVVTMAVS